MNIILFLSDQERAAQHFPPGWAEANLPGLRALQRHGLTFERAFCASPDQWERYDLLNDSLERDNLAPPPGYRPTPEQAWERARLTAKLRRAEHRRLRPLRRKPVPQPDPGGTARRHSRSEARAARRRRSVPQPGCAGPPAPRGRRSALTPRATALSMADGRSAVLRGRPERAFPIASCRAGPASD